MRNPIASYWDDTSLSQKSNLISCDPLSHISDIKLIRTNTTFDLSQKAEKGMSFKIDWLLLLYQLSTQFLSSLPDVGLICLVTTHHSRAWLTTYFLLQTFIINFKCDERLLNIILVILLCYKILCYLTLSSQSSELISLVITLSYKHCPFYHMLKLFRLHNFPCSYTLMKLRDAIPL